MSQRAVRFAKKGPMRRITLAVLVSGVSGCLFGQHNSSMHEQHIKDKAAADHHSAVNSRGDHAMGFSHTKTTHHFRLSKNGGTIQVEANDSKDTESRDQIRGHLGHIALMFAAGNFEAPMFIHDQLPPGVVVMKRLKDRISFTFETTPNGGRVRMASKNMEAVKAMHEFLRFQIADHKTGDPLTVSAK